MILTSIEDLPSDLFRDGMRIGLGGFWFVRTPMALVDALLDSGATDLEVVCFGGGLAVERLLGEGRVRRLLFSFHSMDVLGPAPTFRRALESGVIEGVELTTLVLTKALRAAEENLPFLPIRGPEGSELLDGAYPLPPITCPITGQRLFAVPALPLDLTLVHATHADESGNIEIVGAHGVDLRLLGAARRSVVSVEQVVPPFRGPVAAHRTTLPRFLVDTVVVAPGGARPSSCLPHYPSDLPAIREQLPRPTEPARATATHTEPALVADDNPPPTSAEILVYTLARQLVDGGVYTVGSVTPVSMVAYMLAKLTHAPSLALIPFAGLVDVDFYPVAVGGAESRALEHAHGFWGMEDLYEYLYQAGRIDAEIFCPAQVDQHADINNSSVLRDGLPVRLPGQAGIADVATMHRNLYMYVPRHSPARLVGSLDVRGGSRYLVSDDERAAAGFQAGDVTLVTDLCVLRQDKSTRLLQVESLHPGVDFADVVAATGFPLTPRADLPVTPVPDPETLHLIRRVVDPHGVRNIETVPSAGRRALLDAILSHEANERE